MNSSLRNFTFLLLLGVSFYFGIYFGRQKAPSIEACIALDDREIEKQMRDIPAESKEIQALLTCLHSRKTKHLEPQPIGGESLPTEIKTSSPTNIPAPVAMESPRMTVEMGSALNMAIPPSPGPIAIDKKSYATHFVSSSFSHPNMDRFGVVDGKINSVDDFLREMICTNPALNAITTERRGESMFFRNLGQKIFNGRVRFNKNHPLAQVNLRLTFQARSNGDYVRVRNSETQVNQEERYLPLINSDLFWRYNSCKPGIVLVQDRCPWDSQFDDEMKDLYYLVETNQLVGNVYCRKLSDPNQWTWIAKFILNEA